MHKRPFTLLRSLSEGDTVCRVQGYGSLSLWPKEPYPIALTAAAVARFAGERLIRTGTPTDGRIGVRLDVTDAHSTDARVFAWTGEPLGSTAEAADELDLVGGTVTYRTYTLHLGADTPFTLVNDTGPLPAFRLFLPYATPLACAILSDRFCVPTGGGLDSPFCAYTVQGLLLFTLGTDVRTEADARAYLSAHPADVILRRTEAVTVPLTPALAPLPLGACTLHSPDGMLLRATYRALHGGASVTGGAV